MRNITWAAFFLVAGALLLFYNLGYLKADIRHLEKYWPVLLILIGLSMIIVNKIIKAIIKVTIGILLALYLVAKFTNVHIF